MSPAIQTRPVGLLGVYSCHYTLSTWRPILRVDAALGLSAFGSWTFISCRDGMRKPDPAVFRFVVDKIGVEPERCLFVDDNEANCRVAEAEGLLVHRFKAADGLRRRLV